MSIYTCVVALVYSPSARGLKLFTKFTVPEKSYAHRLKALSSVSTPCVIDCTFGYHFIHDSRSPFLI